MNCEDGSVKAQVQGAPTAIRAVVEALRQIRHIHITEVKVTPLDVIEGETGFSIRYY
jgi:acylphosphatase